MSTLTHCLIVYVAVAVAIVLMLRFVKVPPLGQWRNRWRRRCIAQRQAQGRATDIEIAWLRTQVEGKRRFDPFGGAFVNDPSDANPPPVRPLATGLLWPVVAAALAVAAVLVVFFLALRAAGIATTVKVGEWEEW